MKNEFETYMTDILVSKTIRATVEKIYKRVCIVANVEEFNDIFISEMKNSEGIREYASLWAFDETMFCKATIAKDNKIVLFKLLHNIARYSYETYNYDLETATPSSKITTLLRTFDMQTPFFLSATGINCSTLIDISNKYFIANIKGL